MIITGWSSMEEDRRKSMYGRRRPQAKLLLLFCCCVIIKLDQILGREDHTKGTHTKKDVELKLAHSCVSGKTLLHCDAVTLLLPLTSPVTLLNPYPSLTLVCFPCLILWFSLLSPLQFMSSMPLFNAFV